MLRFCRDFAPLPAKGAIPIVTVVVQVEATALRLVADVAVTD
jgi:hypothetical protein